MIRLPLALRRLGVVRRILVLLVAVAGLAAALFGATVAGAAVYSTIADPVEVAPPVAGNLQATADFPLGASGPAREANAPASDAETPDPVDGVPSPDRPTEGDD